MRPELGIQLVQDDAGLNRYGTGVNVKFDNLI